jgi:hypothetical protein
MEINILTYIRSLTGYYISESVATNIALKRGVLNVKNFEELSEQDIDLLEADVIFSLALRPPKTSSWSKSEGTNNNNIDGGTSKTTTKSHGGFTLTETDNWGSENESSGSTNSESRGSEETGDITDLLEHGCHLYEKWNEPIPCYVLKKIEKSKRGLSWL